MPRSLALRPGLTYWTASHPEWEPDAEPESPADWPREVGWVLCEDAAATVLIDPLVPDELWPELDARVRGRGLPIHVFTTVRWHRRSRADVIDRYDASEEQVDACRPLPLPGFDETLFWLPEHNALVTGDSLIGDGEGGVRLCPQSWLAYVKGKTIDDLRRALSPLLDLPVELLLISHGGPVLADARGALARVLA
jgi:glyoxylase-like metal-dependent hydrolase (beta-lactamase superfamily II)